MSALRTGAAERRRALVAEPRFHGVFDAAIRATRRFVHFSGTERLLLSSALAKDYNIRAKRNRKARGCRDKDEQGERSSSANHRLDRNKARS